MERSGDVPHDFPNLQEAVDALLLGNDIIDRRYPHLLGFTDHQCRNTSGEHHDKWGDVVYWMGFHGHRTVSGTLLASSSLGHYPESATPSPLDDHNQRRNDPHQRDCPHSRDSLEGPNFCAFHRSLQVSTRRQGGPTPMPADAC